mmetsp:Transcript_22056/g.37531  ORF Transcript_22056/g.37531 Transcript_22056/m.37531 type:complete len:228 (-) Transcript_22056:40-723(-)
MNIVYFLIAAATFFNLNHAVASSLDPDSIDYHLTENYLSRNLRRGGMNVGGRFGEGRGGDRDGNRTFSDLTCAVDEEQISCGLLHYPGRPRGNDNDNDNDNEDDEEMEEEEMGDATMGTVICVEATRRNGDIFNQTMCAPASIPNSASDGEAPTYRCGCCDGACEFETCTCTCTPRSRRGSDEQPEADSGFWMMRGGGGGREVCVPADKVVTAQLGRTPYTCSTSCN